MYFTKYAFSAECEYGILNRHPATDSETLHIYCDQFLCCLWIFQDQYRWDVAETFLLPSKKYLLFRDSLLNRSHLSTLFISLLT